MVRLAMVATTATPSASRRRIRQQAQTPISGTCSSSDTSSEEPPCHRHPRRSTLDGIEVVPMTLHIGAEIKGVDFKQPLAPGQLRAIRDAFLKWKVVFFRDQHLDHAQHVAMARQFGEPTIGHAVFGHILTGCTQRRFYSSRQEPHRQLKIVKLMTVTPWFGQHTRCRRRRLTCHARPVPARRDYPSLRRRHVLDQPRGRLRRPVAGDAGIADEPAHHSCLRIQRRRRI